MEPEWWNRFFDGAWLEVQPRVWSAADTRRDADTIEQLLELTRPSRVLDVPCGDGRVALELARRGHRVTGIDATEALLSRGRDRATREHLQLDLRHGDMRDLDEEQAFDAVVCWWGSFGYFDDADNLRFLRAAQRALRPRGRLVLDVPLVETLLPRFDPRSWSEVGGIHVLEQRTYELGTGRVESAWTFLREGRQAQRSTSSIRLYTFRELRQLLRELGFEAVEAYDPDRRAPLELATTGPRCAVVGSL